MQNNAYLNHSKNNDDNDAKNRDPYGYLAVHNNEYLNYGTIILTIITRDKRDRTGIKQYRITYI